MGGRGGSKILRKGGLSVSMSQYGVQGDMAHLESLKMYIIYKVFSAFSPSHRGGGGGGGKVATPLNPPLDPPLGGE